MLPTTKGAVARFFHGRVADWERTVVQVLNIREVVLRVPLPNQGPRYKCTISDGEWSMSVLLSDAPSRMVVAGDLLERSLVRVCRWQFLTVDGGTKSSQPPQRRTVIYEVEVISNGSEPRPLGSPRSVEDAVRAQEAIPVPESPAPGGGGAGAGAGAGAAEPEPVCLPVGALHPYVNRNWHIRARLTKKGDLRPFNNARGGGVLTSVDLLGADGTEIRATAFGPLATELHRRLQEGKVYLVGRGSIREPNARWARAGTKYEINLNEDSVVREAADDGSIPGMKVNFVPLASIRGAAKDTAVDVLGVVLYSPEGLTTFTSRAGKELKKRVLTLVDQHLTAVDLTVWGSAAEQMTDAQLAARPVLAVRSASVSDYGGVTSLSCGFNSGWLLNPDMPEARALAAWAAGQSPGDLLSRADHLARGRGGAAAAGGTGGGGGHRRRHLEEVALQGLGMGTAGQRGELFTARATVTDIRPTGTGADQKYWYPACSNLVASEHGGGRPRVCGKRVTPSGDGMWHCERCNRTSSECSERYFLRLTLADSTDGLPATAFDRVGETVLKLPAAELAAIVREDPEALKEYIQAAKLHTYIFTLRAKSVAGQENTRVVIDTVDVRPEDPVAECRRLLADIAILTGGAAAAV